MSTNDPVQRQMIREAMQAVAQRKPGRSKLVYDKTKRTIVAVTEGAQTPQALNITADDADMFGVITVSSEWLREKWPELNRAGILPVAFSSWDDGDALTQSELCVQASPITVLGTFLLDQYQAESSQGLAILLERTEASSSKPDVFVSPEGTRYRGQIVQPAQPSCQPSDIVFADVEPQLALRRSGILETTILQDKTVLCIGLGTGGAHVVVELAKCGVGRFLLVDRDRLSVGNVVRHPGGISQVGRLKVNVVRDLILEKNPNAKIEAHALEVGFGNKDLISELVRASDIVICGHRQPPKQALDQRALHHCKCDCDLWRCLPPCLRRAKFSGFAQSIHHATNALLLRCPRRPRMSRFLQRLMPTRSHIQTSLWPWSPACHWTFCQSPTCLPSWLCSNCLRTNHRL